MKACLRFGQIYPQAPPSRTTPTQTTPVAPRPAARLSTTLLFDLGADPGERHPLNPDEHPEVVRQARRIRERASADVSWAESEMEKGRSRQAEICCNTREESLCQPFPKCCDCDLATSAAEQTNSVQQNF